MSGLYDLTPAERAALPSWPPTDHLRMEAAMVLWETFIDIEGAEPLNGPAAFNAHRDRVGTVQTRHDLMALVDPLSVGWHVHELAAGDEVMTPFDWGFTPWFLHNCVEVDPATGITLKTGWLNLCREARGQG